MPTYRTSGVWGPGIGTNLTPAMVDANFYELRTAIDDLIANPPTANSIETISASGFNWTITLTDGTVLDPVPIPVVQMVWRGEWAPLTLYSELDKFFVAGQGEFTVLQPHTSAATFDPAAVGGSPATPLYLQTSGVGSNTNLGDLADVTITGVAADDLVGWNGAEWVNRTPADVLASLSIALDDLIDVISTGPVAGQVLRYLGGSPDAGWQPDTLTLDDIGDVVAPSPTVGQVLTWTGSPASWQPAGVAATLDDLTDVSVPAPADGDVLTYQAGSPTGWIAAPAAAGAAALDDLTDVIAPTPADGDVLQFDGADWVNAAGSAISGLTDATIPLVSSSYLEISEPGGSPAVYASRKITAANLLALANIAGLAGGIATFLATPSSANLRAALIDESGTGLAYFQGGALGTPASGTATNLTGLPVSTGISGLGTGVATFLATPSSANLASAVTDETGTGPLVFATSPTLATPVTFNASANGTYSASSLATTNARTTFANTDTTNNNLTRLVFQQTNDAAATVADVALTAIHTIHAAGLENADLAIQMRGGGTNRETARFYGPGDFRVGTGSAIATTAVDGFLLITTSAGAPTGVPTNAGSGQIPIVFDKTNFQLYAYISGTGWKKSAVWT